MGLVDFSLGDVGSVFKDIREAITGKAIEDPNKKAELLMKQSKINFTEKPFNRGFSLFAFF